MGVKEEERGGTSQRKNGRLHRLDCWLSLHLDNPSELFASD